MTMSDMIVAVEKGQKSNITLPDGSLVWINSVDSKLIYGSGFNIVSGSFFCEGEAFEVSPDKDRPFIVKTNDLSVKALEQFWDVKSYG